MFESIETDTFLIRNAGINKEVAEKYSSG
jgi:hypothetical protein